MDLRLGSKRIKAIYKGSSYIPGLIVNDRLWQGEPGEVIVSGGDISGGHKVYYGLSIDNGTYHVSSGGRLYDTKLDNLHAKIIVSSGGRLYNTQVTSGIVEVSSGGNIYSTYTNGSGSEVMGAVYVSSGATARVTHIRGSNVTFSVNGVAYGVTVSSGGALSVNKGGYARTVTILSGGGGETNESACIESVTVLNGGTWYVFGGVLSSGVVSNGGYIEVNNYVYDNGSSCASNVRLLSGGSMVITLKGSAYNTTVAAGGRMTLSEGQATASKTTILANGSVTVLSGCTVDTVVVSSGGTLVVGSGGSAINVSSKTGANIIVYSSGGGLLP